MNKKELIMPILFVSLTVLFSVICVAVYLTGGNSKKWIARKMKIGGLLLSLTVVSCNKGNGGDPIIPTCYDVAASNTMWVQTNGNNEFELNLHNGNTIKGEIDMVAGTDFSFSITNANSVKLQNGTILALDGAFDENNEEFELKIDNTLSEGEYLLNLYDASVESQTDSHLRNRIYLIIKNE